MVSGSLLLLLAVFRRLDVFTGTGGGPDGAVAFAVSVTMRRSVTVVIVIVSTTYLWFDCFDDDRTLFDSPSIFVFCFFFLWHIYIRTVGRVYVWLFSLIIYTET